MMDITTVGRDKPRGTKSRLEKCGVFHDGEGTLFGSLGKKAREGGYTACASAKRVNSSGSRTYANASWPNLHPHAHPSILSRSGIPAP